MTLLTLQGFYYDYNHQIEAFLAPNLGAKARLLLLAHLMPKFNGGSIDACTLINLTFQFGRYVTSSLICLKFNAFVQSWGIKLCKQSSNVAIAIPNQ